MKKASTDYPIIQLSKSIADQLRKTIHANVNGAANASKPRATQLSRRILLCFETSNVDFSSLASEYIVMGGIHHANDCRRVGFRPGTVGAINTIEFCEWNTTHS